MKKNLKMKYLSIFLGLLFLINAFPTNVLAAHVDKSTSTQPLTIIQDAVTKIGTTTIINDSSETYFIPNNTYPEMKSFANNAPNYVYVSSCDNNGQCTYGETATNCPLDCLFPGYCGDGTCQQSSVFVTYNPPLESTDYERVCGTNKQTGWVAIGAGTVVGATIGCSVGGVVGCAVGGALGGIIGLFGGSSSKTTCNDVAKRVYIYEGYEKRGEVYNLAPESGLSQVECRADCAAPAGSGCGICGYDSAGKLCPNYCSNRGYNMVNCYFKPAETIYPAGTSGEAMLVLNGKKTLKKYLTAAEALAYSAPDATSNFDGPQPYISEARYECNYGGDTSSLCPAGKYCQKTGGLKPGTSLTAALLGSSNSYNEYTAPTCPAGFFCPIGSSYPRPCQRGTYSNAGATSTCIACPPGMSTGGIQSPGPSSCQPEVRSNDGVCNSLIGENATNSPYDCPDSDHMSEVAGFVGDGKCSGLENMENSPKDCKCGDGICNNGETYKACFIDCACMDKYCGKPTYGFDAKLVYLPETRTCTTTAGTVINAACEKLNDSDVCGDGTCNAGDGIKGEGYNNKLAKIVCPSDCSCGNGSCEPLKDENLTSCSQDCKCGNGTCDVGYIGGIYFYESSNSCPADCHCGNNKCESEYSENKLNCVHDCVCGDNICSTGETSANCAVDCSTTCFIDNFCDYDAGETKINCIDCKGMTQPIMY